MLCLVHGRIQQVAGRLELEARILARAAELVARWPSRTDVFLESYEYLLTLLGGDPYRDKRRKLNQAALELLRGRRLRLDEMTSEELIEAMAAANGIDIDMPGYKPSVDKFAVGLRDKPLVLGVEGLDRVLRPEPARVAVVLDNAGEAVVDIAAARLLAERLGAELVLIARDEPYEVDVTYREVVELASRLGARARILGTGGRMPVFHPSASPEARSVVTDRETLVLSKGIANLEAFMDFHRETPVPRGLFLLRAKCTPLARFFGVGLADPVAATPGWVVERLASWSHGS